VAIKFSILFIILFAKYFNPPIIPSQSHHLGSLWGQTPFLQPFLELLLYEPYLSSLSTQLLFKPEYLLATFLSPFYLIQLSPYPVASFPPQLLVSS
jgi:hypothetical protein